MKDSYYDCFTRKWQENKRLYSYRVAGGYGYNRDRFCISGSPVQFGGGFAVAISDQYNRFGY